MAVSLTPRQWLKLGLLAVLIGLFIYLNHLQSKVERLEAVEVEAVADEAAASYYIPATREVAAQKEIAVREVQHVQAEHRAWSDQPLPSDAADLLRERPGSEPAAAR